MAEKHSSEKETTAKADKKGDTTLQWIVIAGVLIVGIILLVYFSNRAPPAPPVTTTTVAVKPTTTTVKAAPKPTTTIFGTKKPADILKEVQNLQGADAAWCKKGTSSSKAGNLTILGIVTYKGKTMCHEILRHNQGTSESWFSQDRGLIYTNHYLPNGTLLFSVVEEGKCQKTYTAQGVLQKDSCVSFKATATK
ncbi:Uncharacterised protein [uncultured archaeon]|nr:Uncharacterised protein [uncultured archaeon]